MALSSEDFTSEKIIRQNNYNNNKIEGGKVTILWNQQIQLTEISPTTNQTL